jgi:hypothetical protein
MTPHCQRCHRPTLADLWTGPAIGHCLCARCALNMLHSHAVIGMVFCTERGPWL